MSDSLVNGSFSTIGANGDDEWRQWMLHCCYWSNSDSGANSDNGANGDDDDPLVTMAPMAPMVTMAVPLAQMAIR